MTNFHSLPATPAGRPTTILNFENQVFLNSSIFPKNNFVPKRGTVIFPAAHLFFPLWLMLFSAQLAVAQISIPNTSFTHSEDFNTLATSGSSSTVPSGWAFLETGIHANAFYSAGNGILNYDTYSFGATGNLDRAFGGMTSTSLNDTLETQVGVCYTNNTGGTISALTITYTGETWFVGGLNRQDGLQFQYNQNTTGIGGGGTWTSFAGLDYFNLGQSIGGGSLRHSAVVTATISGLNIAPGNTFCFRWFSYHATGSTFQDGIGIDDYTLNNFVGCTPPTVNAPTVTQPTCAVPTGTIVVNATGGGTLEYSVDNGSNWETDETFSGLSAGNYNIKVRLQANQTCMTTYASNPVVLNSPFSATSTDTWTGCVSTNWATAGNWQDGSLPTSADNVTIPNVTNDPTISTAAIAKSVTVQTGAVLTIAAAGSLTINGSTGSGLTNSGTVTNDGSIEIGNTSIIALHGLANQSIFQNSGSLDIDQTNQRGISNSGAAANFQNSGMVNIGQAVGVGFQGIRNGEGALFTNLSGGTITIDRINIANPETNFPSLSNRTGSNFSNFGSIEIGSSASPGQDGVLNDGTFTNQSSGNLEMNRNWGNGIWNYFGGSFTNHGHIVTGNQDSTGSSGILNYANFTNSATGEIEIDRPRSSGVVNATATGIFQNQGTLSIGQNFGMPFFGVNNLLNGSFTNSETGIIEIDNQDSDGFKNESGATVQNLGKMTLGATAPPDGDGINNAATFNNNACGEIAMFAPLNNSSSFTNAGLFRVNTASANTNSALTNNGIIEYPQGNPIPNVSNNEIIVAPISGGCNISPALSLGATVDFDIADAWFLDENLTLPAGTFNELTNTFSNSNVPSGVPTVVYFSINDAAGGCSRTVSVEITSTCSPCSGTAEISGDETYCPNPGNTVTLTASISTTAQSYLWDDNSTNATRDVSPLVATTYSVVVTDTDGCTAEADFTVTPLALPVVLVSGPSPVCKFDEVSLTASGGVDYEWNSGEMIDEVYIPSATASFVYYVTVTGSNGCTATGGKNLIVKNLPVVNITGNTTLCEGQSTTLSAALSNCTYLWDPTNATTSKITIAPLVTTDYTVIITSNATGCSNSGSVTVNLTGPCTCEDNNILVNPGFENGKTSWPTTGAVVVTQVPSEVHSGSKALRICNNTAGANQRPAALPGQSFIFSGWAKKSGSIASSVGIQFLNASLGVISETNQTINSTVYQEFSITVTAPAGTKWVKVKFAAGPGSGCFYVDDFCLVLTVSGCKNCRTTPANIGDVVSNLLIFPNPTDNLLNISSLDSGAVSGEVSIFNAFGQKVFSENVETAVGEQGILQVGHLPEGAYFLVFRNEKGEISSERFVKM